MKSSNGKNTDALVSRSYRIIVGLLCLCLIGGLVIYSFQSAVERNTVTDMNDLSSVPEDLSVSQEIPVTDSAASDGSADSTAGGSEGAGADEKAAIMPAEGEIVKDYSADGLVYSKTLDQYLAHKAVDIGAATGSAVISMEDGTVTSVEEDSRYGLTIKISHGDGLETVYSCLEKAEVSVGDVVTGGDKIGTVGEGALFETAEGPHLHFETLKDGKPADPYEVWGW